MVIGLLLLSCSASAGDLTIHWEGGRVPTSAASLERACAVRFGYSGGGGASVPCKLAALGAGVRPPSFGATAGVLALPAHDGEGCKYDAETAAQVPGRIVLVQRGGCEFSSKALAAQSYGALGLIVVAGRSGSGATAIRMQPTGQEKQAVSIPAVMVSASDGDRLRAHTQGPAAAGNEKSGATCGATAQSVVSFEARAARDTPDEENRDWLMPAVETFLADGGAGDAVAARLELDKSAGRSHGTSELSVAWRSVGRAGSAAAAILANRDDSPQLARERLSFISRVRRILMNRTADATGNYYAPALRHAVETDLLRRGQWVAAQEQSLLGLRVALEQQQQQQQQQQAASVVQRWRKQLQVPPSILFARQQAMLQLAEALMSTVRVNMASADADADELEEGAIGAVGLALAALGEAFEHMKQRELLSRVERTLMQHCAASEGTGCIPASTAVDFECEWERTARHRFAEVASGLARQLRASGDISAACSAARLAMEAAAGDGDGVMQGAAALLRDSLDGLSANRTGHVAGRLRRVGLTFAGRAPTLRVLAQYMFRAMRRGTIDEWHLFDYTRCAADAAFVADLPNQSIRAGIHEGRIRILFPKPDALVGGSTGRAATWNSPRNGSSWRAHKHGFVAAYRFYADHTWDDAVLVKLDDDIVFADIDRFEDFLRFRELNPEPFFLSANVVNNGVCAFHQQRSTPKLTTAVPILAGASIPTCKLRSQAFLRDAQRDRHACLAILPYPEDGALGKNGALWTSGRMAESVHRAFLRSLRRDFARSFWSMQPDDGNDRLNQASVSTMGELLLRIHDRFSVNLVTWLGTDAPALSEIGVTDEESLTEIPKLKGRANFIFPSFVVAHYSFFPQFAHMSSSTVLARYAELVEGEMG